MKLYIIQNDSHKFDKNHLTYVLNSREEAEEAINRGLQWQKTTNKDLGWNKCIILEVNQG